MSDAEEPFAPTPSDKWLLSVATQRPLIDKLLSAVPELVESAGAAAPTSGCTAALWACCDGLRRSGGRVALVSSGRPALGLGLLKDREDARLYGSDREKELYTSDPLVLIKDKAGNEVRKVYKSVAQRAASYQIGIDVFAHAADGQFVDVGTQVRFCVPPGSGAAPMRDDAQLAKSEPEPRALARAASDASDAKQSILARLVYDLSAREREKRTGRLLSPLTPPPPIQAVLCSTTGGSLHYLAGVDGARLSSEMASAMCRPVGNETVLKLRCSPGLSFGGFIGPGLERAAGELELAVCGADTSVWCEVKHEGSAPLRENSESYVQAALLYTTAEGSRRVRVSTLPLPVSSALAEVWRSADLDSTLGYLSRWARTKLNTAPLQAVREQLTDKCVAALHAYRDKCAKQAPAGQLILPESLKLLPLFVLGMLKSPAFGATITTQAAGGGVVAAPRADERAATLDRMARMPVGEYSSWFYPLVFDCDKITLDDAGGVSDLPVALSASSAHLDPKCMRLIDAGDALYLWVGTAVPDDALMAVFGVPGPLNPADPPPPLASGDGERITAAARLLIGRRYATSHPPPVWVVVATPMAEAGQPPAKPSPLETRVLAALIEDKIGKTESYVDYLCRVHKQIQARLT